MDEVFPVLAGVALGLAAHRARPLSLRAFLLIAGGLGLGVLASWTSGELAISWAYVVIDTCQVLAAGVMTAAGATLWRRRRASRIVA